MAFYLNKGILSRAEFELLEEELKRQAFSMAGIEADHVMKAVHTELGNALDQGINPEEFYANLTDVLNKHGLGSTKVWHSDTVFKNQVHGSLNEGKHKAALKLDRDEFPGMTVVPVGDNRTRKSHENLRGLVWSPDDPVWSYLRPPFDHGCRCRLRIIHKSKFTGYTKEEPYIDPHEMRFAYNARNGK